MPFAVEPNDWDRLLSGLARREYYLLLGAGASAGGSDAFGGSLPLGNALADDLIQEFGIPASAGSIPLPRAYDAAKRREGKRFENVDDYLHARFAGCAAPAWFEILTEIRWARIWTLNIDDTLDAAYVDAGKSRVQDLRPTHWSRPFFEADAWSDVTAVHLHGRARTLGSGPQTENIIFGLEQYLNAGRQRYSWHHVFGDLFLERPFIVVGASLSEEFDLAAVLQRGNASKDALGLPSMVILRDIDDLRREEILDWGLIPVQATGEEFFEAVAHDLPERVRRLPAPHNPGDAGSVEAIRFLSQFRPLPATRANERDERHDLYAGHEPTWQDIVRDRDAVFSVATTTTGSVLKAIENLSPARVFCLHGPRFTGKTTAMLRVARQLIAEGVDAYLFVGEERLDLPALQWWLERSDKAVLLFDGLADYAPDLIDLLEDLPVDELSFAILGTERLGRIRRLQANLPPERLDLGSALRMNALSNADIDALLVRLRDAGRLGRISGRNRGGQISYFREEHRRHLFPSMAGLERGEGFAGRLRRQFSSLEDDGLQRAYGVCCLVHALGYKTPLSLVAAASGSSVRDLLVARRDNEVFDELVVIEDDRMSARQRTLASLITEDVLSRDDRYGLSATLATAIAPHVTPATIRQRTLYARIAGELMDEKVLSDWLGAERVESWYQDQSEYHGWNARFWEQRALAASGRRSWDTAESYAEKAAAIHRDPFTLNTLGTILLRKSIEWAEPSSATRWEYYERGVRALEESRETANRRYMHPFITFFQYSLRFVNDEVKAGSGRLDGRIYRLWSEWMRTARWAPPFAHQEMKQTLEGFEADWLRLAAV